MSPGRPKRQSSGACAYIVLSVCWQLRPAGRNASTRYQGWGWAVRIVFACEILFLRAGDEPGGHVAFTAGILDLDPLIVFADLGFAAGFGDGEFISNGHTFDQG